jgi:serine/threonine protein kinase/tetratricopeptide (TPR) repeat protein
MSCPHGREGSCPECDALASTDKTLQSPDTANGAREDLTPGARVGRYVVHDLIGQGGMGLVYTAHDPELDRWVAIKLLRSNPKQSEEGVSYGQMRLLREAQAMAQLSHPNVLPVYDVGKFGKSVFVAMELVRGVTLDRWVKAQPRTWREILEVFTQAGRGLLAAHAAGLVHRDFKPANVLMGEDSRPRLTDFGIARSARSLDPSTSSAPDTQSGSHSGSSLDTPLTREGAMMGSPGYMAPEQYAGVATSPATDQFAFCASLYEALYGHRPFRGGSLVELAHVTAMGVVPPAPKGTLVPAWLHKVVEQGLARAPSHRHESMEALLKALADDPIQKLKRRLTIAGIAAVLLASIFYAFITQAKSKNTCHDAEQRLTAVWDPDMKLRGERAFLATGKSYAAASWEHARTTLDQYAHAWVLARTEACQASVVRHEQTPEQMQLRYTCLDRRLDELKALTGAFAFADIEVVDQASIAVARLSPLDDCAQVKGLEDRSRVPPEARSAVEQLSQQLAQGRALIAAGKYAAAREKVAPAVESAKKLKLPAPQAEADLALAELEKAQRHYPEARAALESSAHFAEAAGDDATAARAMSQMVSLVGWRLERPDEAMGIAALASGIVERVGSDPRIEAVLLEGLGDAQWQKGTRDESLASYRKALDLLVSTQGPQSPDAARLHASIGWVLSEQGALAEAKEELLKAKAIREKVFGDEHPELGSMWNELGQLAATQGNWAEAAKAYERNLSNTRQSFGAESLSAARAALNVAEALAHDGQPDRAAPLLKLAQEAIAKAPDADVARLFPYQVARVRARIEAGEGRWPEAMKADREALAISQSAFGEEHPDTFGAAFDLARDLGGANRHAEALEVFEKFLGIMDRKGLERDPEYAAALADSAAELKAQGRGREATERLERAVSLLPLDRANPRLAASARFALAESLWTPKGDHSRARRLAAEAHDAYAKASRVDEADHVAAWISAHK